MAQALQILHFTLKQFMVFIFDNMMLFEGVSFGMLLITISLFVVLLRYALAIPKIRIGGGSSGKSKR